MMREYLIEQYGALILRWDEPEDDTVIFEVLHEGALIRANSAALILSAVQDRTHQALRIAA
jgi:hypothetical protein